MVHIAVMPLQNSVILHGLWHAILKGMQWVCDPENNKIRQKSY